MEKSILLALSLALAAPIYAGEHDDKIEMIVEMFKRDPQLKIISSCLEISEDKIITGIRTSMNKCMTLDPTGDSEEFDQCVEQDRDKELRALSPKYDLCKAKYGGEEEDPQLSPEQIQTQVIARMQQLLKRSKEQSAGTKDKISLPIYKGATIMMHFQDGMEIMGIKTLPVASLQSSATIEQIADYYKKALPNFELRVSEGTYQFAKKLPSRHLNFMDFTRAYVQMPHVSISEAFDHSGTRLIEISYTGK